MGLRHAPPTSPRSASPVWLLALATTLAGAIALAAGAVTHQREASRPIGEGALFQLEASGAGAGFDQDADRATSSPAASSPSTRMAPWSITTSWA